MRKFVVNVLEHKLREDGTYVSNIKTSHEFNTHEDAEEFVVQFNGVEFKCLEALQPIEAKV